MSQVARIETTPLWEEAQPSTRYPKVTRNERADAVVIGGGITGITAAYLLAKAGASVVLLERHRVGTVDTGHTSAHLTMVLDTPISTLVSRFGRDHARAAWDAGLAAIQQIEQNAAAEGIDCDLDRVPGYLHVPLASTDDDGSDLKTEADLAADLGFDATFISRVPVLGKPGIRFDDQARFHPAKYIAGLLTAFTRIGGRAFEESAVEEFIDSPKGVKVNGYTIESPFVVVATHNPMTGSRTTTGANLFQTKLALYSTYVLSARVAKGSAPDALMWDTDSPYHYYRLAPGATADQVVYGGGDHKTGQGDATASYEQLEGDLHQIFKSAEVNHHWSGQVIESLDGLPYIGLQAEREFAATAFAGNGLTFGTLAGMMARDAWTEAKNPWALLFDPMRKPSLTQAWDYVSENADYPYYKMRDRLVGPDAKSLRGIGRGQGKIVTYRDQPVAAFRDDRGTLVLRSANCSHMGCLVAWNEAERTWDCPCHGSRFQPDGDVIAGPAESPLDPIE